MAYDRFGGEAGIHFPKGINPNYRSPIRTKPHLMKEVRALFDLILETEGIDPGTYEIEFTGKSGMNLKGQARLREGLIKVHDNNLVTMVHETAHLLAYKYHKDKGHGYYFKSIFERLLWEWRDHIVRPSANQVMVVADEYEVM